MAETPSTREPWTTPTIDAVTDASVQADGATAGIRNGTVQDSASPDV